MLDRNAFGNYRQLLYEITLNPAMGNYLDVAGNTEREPERELRARDPAAVLHRHRQAESSTARSSSMAPGSRSRPTRRTTVEQLFARVFTGWRFATAPAPGVPNYIDPMVANEAQHDTGAKTLLNGVVLPAGQNAAKDLNDAIDNIFNDPNVGPFISKQLIQHLVTSNPSPAYVARVAVGVQRQRRRRARRSEGGRPRDPARPGGARRSEDRAELRSSAASGAVHHQRPAGVRRDVGGRSRVERRLSQSAERRRWAWTCSGRHRSSAISRPATVVAGTAGVRGPEFGIFSTSTALRRANFVNTIVFSRIAVSANAPGGTVARSLAAAGAGGRSGAAGRCAERAAAARLDVGGDAQQHHRAPSPPCPPSNPLKRARTAVVSGRHVVAVSGGEVAMQLTRREFLLQAGHACLGYALGAAAFAAGVQRFGLINALAQGTDYRALVCVFLAGGNDGNNMVVPTSTHRIQRRMQRSAARRGWRFRATACCRSRRPASTARSVCIPAWSELQTLWSRAEAVGRLQRRPARAADRRASSIRAARRGPYQLFSHSDQVAQWQTAIADRVGQTGWGGRIADRFAATDSGFPMITALSGGIFTRGQTTTPLSIAAAPTALNQVLVLNGFGTAATRSRAERRWTSCARSTPTSRSSRRRAERRSRRSTSARRSSSDVTLATVFPNTTLGNQLKQVAKVIKFNADLAGSRAEPSDLLLSAGRIRHAPGSGRHAVGCSRR